MRQMMLQEMLQELRQEARISTDPAHGVHLRDRHVALLRRVQEQLHLEFDWPFLSMVETVAVNPGQRYVAYPSGISLDTLSGVFARDLYGDWQQLIEGITADHLNAVDSDADERRAQPLRFQNYMSMQDENAAVTQFEIWPVPDRAVSVRLAGKRVLNSLVEDTDRSTLDGPMIVLFAAAEILAANKSEDAGLKLQAAQQRFTALKRRFAASENDPINFARPGGSATRAQRFRVP